MIKIMSDGKCDCNAASICPLGRTGSAGRCSRDELDAAGKQFVEYGLLRVDIYSIDDRSHNPGQWFVGLYQGQSKIPLFNCGPYPTAEAAEVEANNRRSALGLLIPFDVSFNAANNLTLTREEIHAQSLKEAIVQLAKLTIEKPSSLKDVASISIIRRGVS